MGHVAIANNYQVMRSQKHFENHCFKPYTAGYGLLHRHCGSDHLNLSTRKTCEHH